MPYGNRRGHKKKEKSPNDELPTKKMADTDTESEGSDNEVEEASMEEMIQSLCKGMKKMNKNFKQVKDELEGIRSNLTKNYNEMNEKLNEYIEQNTELKEKLEEANLRIDALTECNMDLYLENEKSKDEKKAFNVVIRGIPEVDKEKMYETMDSIFECLQPSFNYTSTNGVARLGRAPTQQVPNKGQGQGQRPAASQPRRPPRPIKLYCATRQQKGELFRNAHKLKQNQKYAKVSISSDLSDEQMLTYKEVQMIHNAASKLPNVVSKMRGNMIEIDGKVYQKKDFGNLPHSLTLEQASTILTKEGVMFASHCSPLSNLSSCKITIGDISYISAEQKIVHELAALSQDQVVATKVLFESNPYKIKRLSKLIRKSEDWSIEKEKEIVKDSIIQKFDQNPQLRSKLIKTKATQFYEATFDPIYGAGFNLQDAQKGNTTPKPYCENYTGKVLTELKGKYSKQKK